MASDGGVTEGMKAAGYYDAHSEYQRRVVEGGDAIIRSIVEGIDLDSVGDAFTVADYGAGTGAPGLDVLLGRPGRHPAGARRSGGR